MPLRLSLLLLILAGVVAPLRAQTDGPIKMDPEFPLTFPLEKKGSDVTIKYPVMINPSTVLKPGMVMRVLYILNYNTDGSSDLALAHHGNMEQAYARTAAGSANEIPSDLAHEIEGYRRTVWDVPNNFILAMAQYPTSAMHLIYSTTGKDQDLADERFSFFDGLFIGLPGGKVTVLAVEKESKAEKAGLKAGDEILTVGDFPLKSDLATFAAAYSATKKNATELQAKSYPMTIRTGGETRTVNVPMPPSFKSGFLDK